jgi:hypothetical protein
MEREYLREGDSQMEFTYNLFGRVYQIDKIKALGFSFETLNDDLIEHAKIMALLTTFLDDSTSKLEKLEDELENLYNQTFLSLKATKRYTEKEIEYKAKTSTEYVKLQKSCREAKRIRRECFSMVNNFKDRFEAMRSFGTNVRNAT